MLDLTRIGLIGCNIAINTGVSVLEIDIDDRDAITEPETRSRWISHNCVENLAGRASVIAHPGANHFRHALHLATQRFIMLP